MSREIIDLAEASLRLYDQEVSPAYAALRQKFDNALGRYAIENYEQNRRQAQANYAFTRAVVQQLPRVELPDVISYGERSAWPRFVTAQQSEAKLLQASTVWMRTAVFNDGQYISYPYYVVGIKPDKKITGLLLYAAASQNNESVLCYRYSRDFGSYSFPEEEAKVPPLMAVTAASKRFAAYKAYAQQQLGTPYNADELNNKGFYDLDSGHFLLTQQSPGGDMLNSHCYLRRHEPKNRGMQHWEHINDIGYLSSTEIPAETFATLDVFGFLSHLTTAFGKVEAMKEQLPLLQITDS